MFMKMNYSEWTFGAAVHNTYQVFNVFVTFHIR